MFFNSPPTMSPADISAALARQEITLIDVREPSEHAAERIEGALHHPLSSFDPAKLPRNEQKPIVFHCLSGKRSATAYKAAANAGIPLRAHMAGGITAWKLVGLPTTSSSR